MRKAFSMLLLLFLLIGLNNVPGHSIKTQELVENMIKAQGGRKALENINDMTLTCNVELFTLCVSGTMTIYQKEPNKLRVDSEVMGRTITYSTYDETALWNNPQTGAIEEMPEYRAEGFLRDSLGNDATLHPEKYGITFNYKGKEKIDEKEYLVLEQIYADGFVSTFYIDPETFLTYLIRGTTYNERGVESEAEEYLTDYKKVNGILIAHSKTSYIDGEKYMRATIENVSINTGLDDSLFKIDK